MSPLQQEYFRQRLQTGARGPGGRVQATIENLREEVRDIGDEAERATRETENSLELRTRDRYRKLIGKIDSTLKRLEAGDYGYCVDTGEEIGLERLEARLTAERTIDAQERWEHLQAAGRPIPDRCLVMQKTRPWPGFFFGRWLARALVRRGWPGTRGRQGKRSSPVEPTASRLALRASLIHRGGAPVRSTGSRMAERFFGHFLCARKESNKPFIERKVGWPTPGAAARRSQRHCRSRRFSFRSVGFFHAVIPATLSTANPPSTTAGTRPSSFAIVPA